MDGKVVAGIAAVVVVVAAIGGVFLVMNSGPVTVGVIYDGNGHQTSDGETSYSYAMSTIQESRFEANGYVLAGWNTARDGSGTTYHEGDPISYPDNGNITLYAQWAYGIHISPYASSMPGELTYVVTETIGGTATSISLFGNVTALPTGGSAIVGVTGHTSTAWQCAHESGSNTVVFTLVDGSYTDTVTLEFTGAQITGAQVSPGGNPYVQITYDGNVTFGVDEKHSHNR